MTRFRVKETTKQKDNGEKPQESIQEVIDYHQRKGRVNDGLVKGIVKLQKEPNGEIAVYLKGKRKYHIGYIEKANPEEVTNNFMNKSMRLDAEFFETESKVTEVFIHPRNTVDIAAETPFFKKGDGSEKTKILNRLALISIMAIVFMIILIILT